MATEITSTQISTDILKLVSTTVPATSTSPGEKGQLAWDQNFLYVCIETNLWARTNISIAWGEV